MFVVEIGAVLTLLFIIQALVSSSVSQVPITYFIALDVWLFLTVLFANFATALAEARGKAQAESLAQDAKRDAGLSAAWSGDAVEEVRSTDLRAGDRVVVTAGQIIPSDGEVIHGHRLGGRSPRSRANPHRSSARQAAITRVLPAARASFPIGSSSRLLRSPVSRFLTA